MPARSRSGMLIGMSHPALRVETTAPVVSAMMPAAGLRMMMRMMRRQPSL